MEPAVARGSQIDPIATTIMYFQVSIVKFTPLHLILPGFGLPRCDFSDKFQYGENTAPLYLSGRTYAVSQPSAFTLLGTCLSALILASFTLPTHGAGFHTDPAGGDDLRVYHSGAPAAEPLDNC